jgi:ribonuclease P protein subunit RPR2
MQGGGMQGGGMQGGGMQGGGMQGAGSQGGDRPLACVACPIGLDGDIVAVLAIAGPTAGAGEEPQTLDWYLAKTLETRLPLGLSVARLRIKGALDHRGDEITALRRQLDAYAVDLRWSFHAEKDRSQELAQALAELEETYRATVHTLAVAVEAKDECTGGHLQRVSRYGMMLTRLVAPEHWNDPQFEYGFLLHDIGKLTVPDYVLAKPEPLNDAEWDLMRAHPAAGHSILQGVPFLAVAREIVYCHHERVDGTGYPRGLREDEIPLGAKIFPLCDAFDAMTCERPYREALSIEAARLEIAEGAGTQFWRPAVEAFLSLPVDTLELVRATVEGPQT